MQDRTKTEQIKQHCAELKLTAMASVLEDTIAEAEREQTSYLELVYKLVYKEVLHRKQRALERRTALARLPASFDLDLYDFNVSNGLEKRQFNQLRELSWLEQSFNIVLLGPSGVGKTYIAAGMCFDAVRKGYRAYFMTMEELLKTLKLKDVIRTANLQYKRILKSHLLAIDDIMMFPVTPQDGVAFFNLINELHDKTSLIITSNKSPKQWAEVLQDDVLTTALLDRILHRCEIIKLSGKSYRMMHRKSIFDNQ